MKKVCALLIFTVLAIVPIIVTAHIIDFTERAGLFDSAIRELEERTIEVIEAVHTGIETHLVHAHVGVKNIEQLRIVRVSPSGIELAKDVVYVTDPIDGKFRLHDIDDAHRGGSSDLLFSHALTEIGIYRYELRAVFRANSVVTYRFRVMVSQ